MGLRRENKIKIHLKLGSAVYPKMCNRLIVAVAAKVRSEIHSADGHHNAFLVFDSSFPLLLYSVHMMNISTQRRISPRIKGIQSSVDKAIPIVHSKYPNIRRM